MVAGKYVLAGVAASTLGILLNPEMMAASNSVTVTRLDEMSAIETIVDPSMKGEFVLKLEEIQVAAEETATGLATASGETTATESAADEDSKGQVAAVPSQSEVSGANKSVEREPSQSAGRDTAAAAPVRQAAQTAARNNIQIPGRTVELRQTSSTTEDAGTAARAWYYEGGRFIYGHNLSQVFGGLVTAYDNGTLMGAQLSVTMGGATRQYKVTGVQIYTTSLVSWKMASLVNGGGHALALMTCYGNDRLVVFAD